MPDAHRVEADRGLDLDHGAFVAFLGDDVVAGHVGVAGVEAHGYRRMPAQEPDQLGHLVEAAAQGTLGAGGVLDEEGEAGALPGKPVHGALDGFGGKAQAGVAAEAFPRAGMEDEVVGAEGEGALDFTAHAHDTFFTDDLRLAAEIDQVAGVDGEGADFIFGAEFMHALGLDEINAGGPPHAGAGGKDLEGVGADFVRAQNGVRRAACRA